MDIPYTMDISSIALQGLEQAQARLEQAAAKIVAVGAESSDGANLDTVDISAEMVALMSAKNQFLLDLGTLKTADEIQKNLIDVMA